MILTITSGVGSVDFYEVWINGKPHFIEANQSNTNTVIQFNLEPGTLYPNIYAVAHFNGQ